MGSRWTDQGIEDLIENHLGIGTVDPVDAMSVSDFGNIVAGTTTIASATFKQVNALDATPTRASLTGTIVATFTDAQIGGNNITTILAHNDGAGTNTGAQYGVDSQDLTFSGVDITIELDCTGASAP